MKTSTAVVNKMDALLLENLRPLDEARGANALARTQSWTIVWCNCTRRDSRCQMYDRIGTSIGTDNIKRVWNTRDRDICSGAPSFHRVPPISNHISISCHRRHVIDTYMVKRGTYICLYRAFRKYATKLQKHILFTIRMKSYRSGNSCITYTECSVNIDSSLSWVHRMH